MNLVQKGVMNMLKWHLWIDDVRQPPNDTYWAWLSTTDEVIKFFKTEINSGIEIFDVVSLDHDAGDFAANGGDYIKILNWLEEYYPKCPHVFHIHSMNPVGKENMESIIYRNEWSYIRGEIE